METKKQGDRVEMTDAKVKKLSKRTFIMNGMLIVNLLCCAGGVGIAIQKRKPALCIPALACAGVLPLMLRTRRDQINAKKRTSGFFDAE